MADVKQSRPGPRPAAGSAHLRTGSAGGALWLGWVVFVGILLFSDGLLNAVEGLVALFDDNFYRARATELAVGVDYTVWGWALLVLGLGLVAAGIGIVLGYDWARVV